MKFPISTVDLTEGLRRESTSEDCLATSPYQSLAPAEELHLPPLGQVEFTRAITSFWPKIVRYQNGYFVEPRFDPANVDEWLNSGTELTAVEQVVNHCHLWDLLGEPYDESLLRELGRLMALAWLCTASLQYPGTSFVVDFADDPEDYGPTVYLWTDRG